MVNLWHEPCCKLCITASSKKFAIIVNLQSPWSPGKTETLRPPVIESLPKWEQLPWNGNWGFPCKHPHPLSSPRDENSISPSKADGFPRTSENRTRGYLATACDLTRITFVSCRANSQLYKPWTLLLFSFSIKFQSFFQLFKDRSCTSLSVLPSMARMIKAP